MTDVSTLSDNAIMLWQSFFSNPHSTLTFGGDYAEYEITPEARAALDELMAVRAVVPREPDDQWPNRESYKVGDLDLREEVKSRPHLNPFATPRPNDLVLFRKKPVHRDRADAGQQEQ